MLNPKQYLVLATGTDIGKTLLVEKICHLHRNATAIKPIITGFAYDDMSDAARIIKAIHGQDHIITSQKIEEISPWRFPDPISPHIAGKIDFDEVVLFCTKSIKKSQEAQQLLLIESSGGVMTPITDEKTFLDLASTLSIPILLVIGDYLGSISHSLCAITALKAAKVEIGLIVINQSLKPSIDSTKLSSIIEYFSGSQCVTIDNIHKFFGKSFSYE